MKTVKQPSNPKSHKLHKSLFSHWHETSWIRSKPIRQDAISGLPFSPELVPLASHPLIVADYQRWINVLGYHLLAHLQFTTLLELNHVNSVCSALAQGKAPILLSTQQRNDALKIYCDEGGHALFVEDFSHQVEEAFALNRSVVGRPSFERVMEKIIAENQTQLSSELIKLFFVTISETLVTKVLKNIPHDPEVASVVREVINDHAVDEALHSAYFRNLFPLLWAHLSAYEKEKMIHILPKLVWAFLSPDRQLEYSIIRRLGFNAPDAEDILQEVYIPEQVALSVKQAASPTLKMFEAAGVFNIPSACQIFADYQLI
ncbi:MAG: diiron oxygenase [Nodularia sp. CChRGM 3473]